MGVKRCFCATILILLLSLCFGMYKRLSYTDISRGDSYLEHIYVAEMPETYALSECEKLADTLPQAPLIARVTAVKGVEHLSRTSRQLVRVKAVYCGTVLQEGEEIYITYRNWSLSLYGDPYSMERGFVNILNTGEDYLVFMDKQVDGLGEKTPIYELYGENSIAPVFSYEEHENTIVETGMEHTYVLYSQVRENEFFAETPAALDAMEALKEQMITRYL